MSELLWLMELNDNIQEINEVSFKKSVAIAARYIKNVAEIRNELNYGKGFFLIKDLPIDDGIPQPPLNDMRPYGKTFISEHVLTGVMGLTGYNPFSYQEEKNGLFIHEITPVTGNEEKKSSNGIVDFAFHTDAAYLPDTKRPEVLSLICLKNDSGTGTDIVSLPRLLNKLSQSTTDILKSKSFIIRSPDSFELKQESLTSVLYESNGNIEIKLSTETITPVTVDAQKALSELIKIAHYEKDIVLWEPGDFLILNNRRTLHGRRRITGTRWLQRCYGLSTVHPFTIFSARE